ncbi:MAG: hypothetical protein HW421_3678 [Ignavibacteria bacterium]|nr:hypothetical protein [Ignavibacteria bacterium]
MKQKRHYIDFLIDIYHQTRMVKKFISNVKFEDFNSNTQLFYAICRTLEIIGEATKNLPKEMISHYPDIEWSKMAKLREIIIHHYTGLDEKVIWDICKIDIKDLQKTI